MKKKKDGPIKPRPASTVILVRDGGGKLQVYLLKRSEESGFFPGNYVFPGGALDPEDSDTIFWKTRTNLSEDEIGVRFGNGISTGEVFPYIVSAIRETFEEAGVFLAIGGDERTNLGKVCNIRNETSLEIKWMYSLFDNANWMLDLSRLYAWSHWITPEFMKHRFNTRFFIAVMPPDQSCAPDNREMTDGVWVSPEEGLAGNLNGEIPLSPPTVVTLTELLEYRNLEALLVDGLKEHSWGEARRPRLIPSEEGPVILQPWDPMCEQDGDIDRKDLEKRILPAGSAFSRIWFHKGIWRPIGVT